MNKSLKTLEIEFPLIIFYVAIFGLSDLFVKQFLHSNNSQLFYYIFLLIISTSLYYDYSTNRIRYN